MRFGMEDIEGRVQAPDAREQTEIRETVLELARPRLTGTPGAAAVSAHMRGELEGLGYEVRELPFSFSTWPGRFGVSIVGVLVLLGSAGAAWLAGTRQGGWALIVLAVVAALIGVVGYTGRSAISRLPWGRIETANWLVVRPGARPRYIVAAHRDSKGQPVPLALRAAAVVAALLTAVALVLLAMASLLGPPWWKLAVPAWIIGVVGVAAGAVLAACVVTNGSPGALDNATGLAALLGLARREAGSDDIAFLVTDGEELGLAGAAAVGRQLPRVYGIINLDGLDDEGDFHIIEQHGLPRRGLAPQLAAALLAAAARLGTRAERRALPVGVMVDHIPLVEAGFPAVTLMRGTARSLRRVHRPEDDAAHLNGVGAAAAVALVAGALGVLREAPGAP
ncbi:MAG TPA: M28 family peptidase [Longimicrobiales bacterium]|nr:M28 family peptidase [Longimicrobiales bacterium]